MTVRLLISLLVVLLLATDALAQERTTPLAGQRAPAQVMLWPVYQQYQDGDLHLAEFSTALTAYLPVGRNAGLSLRAGQAQASGDVENLGGLTDIQMAGTYYQALGRASIVGGLTLNLPSGKQALTPAEFQTLVLLSRTVYDFQTPTLGQGFGAATSLTLALSLNDRMVIGGGVSYQYRGAFEPVAEMQAAYDPGDEITLTAGVDVQLAPHMVLSGDVSYTTYGTDAVGEEDVFAAGSKIAVRAAYRAQWGERTLTVQAQHRSRGKSDLLASAEAAGLPDVLPTQTDLFGQYRMRLHERFELGVLGEARVFEETARFPAMSAFGAGVTPVLRLSRRVHLPARFVYNFGDLTGVEAGIGLVVLF